MPSIVAAMLALPAAMAIERRRHAGARGRDTPRGAGHPRPRDRQRIDPASARASRIRAAETAQLGPAGTRDDIMGPDRYRTHLLFQPGMPELRNGRRFPRLCARLGLVEFWMATGKWPDCADEVSYDFRMECAGVHDILKESFGF